MILAALAACVRGSDPPAPVETDAPASSPTGDTGQASTTDTGAPPPPGPCGVPVGVEAIGGPGTQSSQELSISADGTAFVGGYFDAPFVLDPGGPHETTLTPAAFDGYVARYAPDGSLAWARQLATPSSAFPDAVAATDDGGVIVVGAFYEAITVAAGQPDAVELRSAGESDGFVARFGVDGALLWAVRLGGASHDFVLGLGVRPDGAALVSGLYRGDATFGPGEAGEVVLPVHPFASESGFVARLGPDGSLAWAERFGGTQYARSDGAAYDRATDELAVIGLLSGPGVAELPTSPPMPLDPVGASGFVARWSVEGGARAVAVFGGFPAAIDLGADGDALIVGTFFDEVVLGAGEATETTLTTRAHEEVFVARLDREGALAWASQTVSPPATNTSGRGIVALPDGGAVVVGDFTSRVRLGPGTPAEVTFATEGSYDAFVARFEADGAFGCAAHVGGPGLEIGVGVRRAPDGTVRTVGDFERTAVFGLGTAEAIEVRSLGDHDGALTTWRF